MPLAPAAAGGGETLGKTSNGYWIVELDTVAFRISPVVLASKLTWVFGPGVAFPAVGEKSVARKGSLLIGLFAWSTREGTATVTFDPRQFRVVLDDGRSLSPIATRPYFNSEERGTPSPITYSVETQGKWLWLEYDVLLADLTPFALQLGSLTVNGNVFHIPQVSFVEGKSMRGT